MNPLNTFYNNVSEKTAVKEFLIDTLKEMAIERAFNGESVAGIQEAKEAIDTAFNKLDEAFSKKPDPIITDSR